MHAPSRPQHAPPHGLLGAHAARTPWNTPEHAPEVVYVQTPDAAQHAPVDDDSTFTV
jgi:hypothetical protein